MKGAEKSKTAAPYAGATWIHAINRLLRLEERPNPRPKPGHPPRLKTWNQADLAEAAGFRDNTLTDILKGKRRPSLETLEALATALGQPVFLFLMDPAEAERYARFHVADTADVAAKATQVSAQQIAAELGPEIAALIERRMIGQPVALQAKELAGRPTLAHSAPVPAHKHKVARKKHA